MLGEMDWLIPAAPLPWSGSLDLWLEVAMFPFSPEVCTLIGTLSLLNDAEDEADAFLQSIWRAPGSLERPGE